MTNPAILRRLQGPVGIFSGSHGRLPRAFVAALTDRQRERSLRPAKFH